MAINLGSDFTGINSVLNENLSKYTTLKIIKMNQNTNIRYYATGAIREGFYYKEARNPRLGQVVATLKIVPLDSNVDSLIRTAKMLELGDDEGNFLRFGFQTDKEPAPPSYQWILIVTPNLEDIDTIT